jgi:hypothetical protein
MSGSIRLHREYGLNPTIPICFICGKEKNELVLLGAAYKEQAPMHMCLDKEPCDECKKMMDMGVLLVSVKNGTDHENPYRTGGFCVIKEEAAQRMFGSSIGNSRMAFVEDEAWDKIGLPRSKPEEKAAGKTAWD